MDANFSHRDDFDRLIQQSYSEQASNADAFVWDNIEAALHPKKKRIAVWWWFGSAASVLLILAASLLWFKSGNSEKEAPRFSTEEGEVNRIHNASEILDHENASDKSTLESSVAHDETEAKLVEQNDKENSERFKSSKENNGEHNAQFASAFNKNARTETGVLNPNSKSGNAEANLNKMPTLYAQVDVDPLDVVFEKRNFPMFVDMPKEPTTGSDFLAANYTSGSGNTAYGSNFEASRMNFSPTISTDSESLNTADDTETDYQAPFSLGFRAAKTLSRRWFVESGLGFSLLSKNLHSPSGQIDPTTIREYYVGVPLLFDFEMVQKPKLSMMLTSGWQIEKGIAARAVVKDNSGTGITYLQAPGVQLGWVFGFASEYRINSQFGVFLQPSITYWMYSSNGIENIRNYSVLWPNVQLGLRYRLH